MYTYMYIYIYIYTCIYIYIYTYVYGCCPIPPCFLTTLQYTKLHGVQAKRSHLYIIMQKHTITHVYCRRETLGISGIYRTCI